MSLSSCKIDNPLLAPTSIDHFLSFHFLTNTMVTEDPFAGQAFPASSGFASDPFAGDPFGSSSATATAAKTGDAFDPFGALSIPQVSISYLAFTLNSC